MVIRNVKIMHQCFSKHSCMGTARRKSDKDTKQESKKSGINMERSTVDTQKWSDCLNITWA